MLKTIQDIRLHDHTCMGFNSALEFFHCAIPFISEGLKNNEKCLLIIDEITKEETFNSFRYLNRKGKRVFDELFFQDKRIRIELFKNFYLPDNTFNMERMGETYLAVLNEAISEGYSGLRAFVEISYSAKNHITLDDFYNWEKAAQQYFKDNKFLAVCAYNKKYFTEDYFSKITKLHPVEIDLLKTRL